jgi:hypothetical protein
MEEAPDPHALAVEGEVFIEWAPDPGRARAPRGEGVRAVHAGTAAARRMSVELKKVVIGLDEDTYRTLRIMAEVNDQDIGEAGRALLIESLFGKSHGIKLAAARFARATKAGNTG